MTVISPHNNEIQEEFGSAWDKAHPDMPVKWINQGGTPQDLLFVTQGFKGRSKAQGVGVDVFFGGGGETFTELQKGGMLAPFAGKSDVPTELNKVPLRAKDGTWVAAALSGFGMLYNKQIAARDGLPIPKTWADLGNPKLQDRIELADPRHSGSAHAVYEIILQTNGWDKGWRILTAMAGNSRRWMTSSSEPLQDVGNGEAVFCTAIDFYATNAIHKAGAEKLGYIQPTGQNLITPDPIAVLQGAPNAKGAQAFMEWVLSPAAQKLWSAKVGTPGGPLKSTLSRLPALPAAYGDPNAFTDANPYKEKVTATYDSDKAARRHKALDELIGAALVDNADAVVAKWKQSPTPDASGYVPLPEKEFDALADKWGDAAKDNVTKQAWSANAAKFFGA